jgi:hypothetical protein
MRTARLLVVVAAHLAATAGVARGNGRPPATTSVHVRPGAPDDIYLAVTFGLLISRDGGCSFRWVCEDNIGYGGTFDPHYAVGADGTIYAATFAGLRISHDGGCSFTTATADVDPRDPDRFAERWVDALALGPTGTVWAGTAETAGPNDVYRSDDAGATFASVGLGSDTIWWKSLAVAPSDGDRVYVSGYELAHPDVGIDAPTAHVRRTDDGGASWDELPLDGVATASTPVVKVMAVDPGDPDTLWLRSMAVTPPDNDELYRSTDGGMTWEVVLQPSAAIADLVVRDSGEVAVAVPSEGLYVSSDGGASFALVGAPPRLGCLDENAAGELLGCGTNWKPDFAALASSADGETWDKVFRLVEMAGPVACPAGTPQHDVCEVEQWPTIERQFATTGSTCDGPVDGAPAIDARADGDGDGDGDGGGGGCCQTGAAGDAGLGASIIGVLAIGGAGLRRRRRR